MRKCLTYQALLIVSAWVSILPKALVQAVTLPQVCVRQPRAPQRFAPLLVKQTWCSSPPVWVVGPVLARLPLSPPLPGNWAPLPSVLLPFHLPLKDRDGGVLLKKV